ncbi:MAG: stage II sporulation protein M [Actinomycetes bacterium]
MDLDAYVAQHRDEWDRLAVLVGRAGRRGVRERRLTAEQADELVERYQRVAVHLSVLRAAAPDPVLLARLSGLVGSARAAITGTRTPVRRDVRHFLLVAFPVAVYRARAWWVGTALAWMALAAVLAVWVAGSPQVQAHIATPREIRSLVEPGGAFQTYYHSNPAAAFAASVWTNNAWVAAMALVSGVLLGLPTLWVLLANAANVGVSAGLMAAAGRLGVFFALITPHGMLELTAVFVAAGTGLRLGWTVIDPGPLRRTEALAQQGRTAVAIALGLVGVLAVSGAIEAFVTPSPLPTWARVGVGVLAEVAFLGYVTILGRRGVRSGQTGDLVVELVGPGGGPPIQAHNRPAAFNAR